MRQKSDKGHMYTHKRSIESYKMNHTKTRFDRRETQIEKKDKKYFNAQADCVTEEAQVSKCKISCKGKIQGQRDEAIKSNRRSRKRDSERTKLLERLLHFIFQV